MNKIGGKIGLIDVDGHNYPNLALMKISSYHKKQRNHVEWYEPLWGGVYDIVYMSKVFSDTYSIDYQYPINAKKVYIGGSGYCINTKNGVETYNKSKDIQLPYEIEHSYPDTSIYKGKIKDVENTAYGFMSRGCPRNCPFCHVAQKEGAKSYKVADLAEFWSGEKYIEMLDPNILACKERKELLQQLIDSKAKVNINQGLDMRFMTEEIAKMFNKMNYSLIHCAWDNYEDKDKILHKIKMFKEITGISDRKLVVYVLCNFNTTIEQDIERVETLKKIGTSPYVMIYNKNSLTKGNKIKHLQRYCNNRFIFFSCKSFEQYMKGRN